jgi:hypothetical protein
MNQITPVIRLLTHQESLETGLQIKTLILEHNCNCYHLSGATGDTIYTFTQGVLCIYVLTINKPLGYIGLNVFMQPQPDPINSIFLQSERDIRETLGNKWEKLSPMAITRRLINYLI